MSTKLTAHVLGEKWRSTDIEIHEDTNFSSFLLSEKILLGLTSAGFVRPSPVQLQAIPLGRYGLDLIVQAKSGTGKTCVFAVVALEKLLMDALVTQVLVLAPTREVAVQICQVVQAIGVGFKGLQCHTFIGGMPLHEDKVKLRKCHIAVGTPGRIKQLIKQDLLKTNSIRLFVLDEADKLLEENFQECINWIYSSLPVRKQMLALSATYPEELAQMLKLYMNNPSVIRLNADKPALLGVKQFSTSTAYHPMQHVCFQAKVDALVKILNCVSFSQCLVFSNYQTRAESLCDVLKKRGWPTEYISGSQEQTQRLRAMDKLKAFQCRVLVSTDVTSRGIDVENVNLVINMDVPWEVETYLHRIGRAGRFGSKGLAISFVSGEDETVLFDQLKVKGHLQVSVLPDPMPPDLWKYEDDQGQSMPNSNIGGDTNNVFETDSSEVVISEGVQQFKSTEYKGSETVIEGAENSSADTKIKDQEPSSESSVTDELTKLVIGLPTESISEALAVASTIVEKETDGNAMNSKKRLIAPIFSYDSLLSDFDRSLLTHKESGNGQDTVTELDEETSSLLSLNSFLINNHEQFRLKMEDEFDKCNSNKEQSEQSENVSTKNTVTEVDEETALLLSLNSFLVSNHEQFRRKMEDELHKCNSLKEHSEPNCINVSTQSENISSGILPGNFNTQNSSVVAGFSNQTAGTPSQPDCEKCIRVLDILNYKVDTIISETEEITKTDELNNKCEIVESTEREVTEPGDFSRSMKSGDVESKEVERSISQTIDYQKYMPVFDNVNEKANTAVSEIEKLSRFVSDSLEKMHNEYTGNPSSNSANDAAKTSSHQKRSTKVNEVLRNRNLPSTSSKHSGLQNESEKHEKTSVYISSDDDTDVESSDSDSETVSYETCQHFTTYPTNYYQNVYSQANCCNWWNPNSRMSSVYNQYKNYMNYTRKLWSTQAGSRA